MRLTEEGGMCYVIRQENGSFIIVDGGMGGNSYREHADLLFSILKEECQNHKPVIECWFITHFHSDHIDLASGFLLEYKDEIHSVTILSHIIQHLGKLWSSSDILTGLSCVAVFPDYLYILKIRELRQPLPLSFKAVALHLH